MIAPGARLVVPDFGEREACEAAARGYLGTAYVEFADGRRFGLVFYDPVRLQQDLVSETEDGRPFLAAPGLVIVTEVTMGIMQAAVSRLLSEGYFNRFVPQSGA